MAFAHVRYFQTYKDASGAPAVIESLGYVFALDLLGKITVNLVPGNSAVADWQYDTALAAVRNEYDKLLAKLPKNYRERNRAMYADSAPAPENSTRTPK